MKDEDKLVENNLLRKACRAPAKSSIHRLSDLSGSLLFRRCPGNFVSIGMLGLIAAHDAFERGIPPFAGGYFDQPPKILDAFEIISAWKRANERRSNERALKGMKGGVGGRQ